MDLDNRVLYVTTKSGLDDHKPYAILCPSGEEVVYAHWQRRVRRREDLPIEMYRRCSYFRPVPPGRSGLSLFRAAEARDVFEFHACFVDEAERRNALERYLQMLRDLTDELRLPVLFSTRPTWTNNKAVSQKTIGGDLALPTGSTLQIACLYEQGQIFSRAFGIGFQKDGAMSYAEQVTGATSRRLLFTHLLLGMDADGCLFVHPDLAPDPVIVVFCPGSEDDLQTISVFAESLRARGTAVLVELASADSIRSVQKRHRLRGVPLEILLFGRRSPADSFKVVLTRADTRSEASMQTERLIEEIGPLIRPLLREIGSSYESRVSSFFERQLAWCDGESLENQAKERRLLACPMLPSEDNVHRAERLNLGEVLGFARDSTKRTCVFTGEETSVVAFLSPRF
jgi:prolyl-tRNA synthetase